MEKVFHLAAQNALVQMPQLLKDQCQLKAEFPKEHRQLSAFTRNLLKAEAISQALLPMRF